jgi:hypothetical protein
VIRGPGAGAAGAAAVQIGGQSRWAGSHEEEEDEELLLAGSTVPVRVSTDLVGDFLEYDADDDADDDAICSHQGAGGTGRSGSPTICPTTCEWPSSSRESETLTVIAATATSTSESQRAIAVTKRERIV